MVITKERPRRSPTLKNRTAKVRFEAAAGSETFTGTGLTLLRLVPVAFDTTLGFVHSAGGGEVASLAVSPADVHEKLVSYWKDHRQLPMTDRLEFIINDMAALAKMSADTEQALMLQMIFHSVSDKIQPFMPHAGLRLIYDTAPNEARWALAQLSESKPIDLGDNALYVDIITTAVAHGAQGVGGGSDSVEERKEAFLSLLESFQKPAVVSKQQGASEIGPEIFARVVDIGWLNGYLEEYEFPEEEEIDRIHSSGAHHHLDLLGPHPSHGGSEHDHDLSNFTHAAVAHAAIAHEIAEHMEVQHATDVAHDGVFAHSAADHVATDHAGDGAAHAIGAAHGIDAGHGAYLLRHADEAHKHQDEWAHEQRAETERAEAERLESEAMALEHVPGRHAEAAELWAEAAGERELAREDSAEALQDAREAEFDRQQDTGFEAMERSEGAEYLEAEYAEVEYPERAEYAETEYPERADYAEVEYAEGAEAPEVELAEAEYAEMEYAEAAEAAEIKLAEAEYAEPAEYAEAELAEAREIEAAEVAEAVEASEGAGEAAEVAEIAEAGEAAAGEAAVGEGAEAGVEAEAVEAGGAEGAAAEAAEAPGTAESGETVEVGEPQGAAETGAEAGGVEPAGAAEQQEARNESLRAVQEGEAQEREQTAQSIDEAKDRVQDAAEKQEQAAEQINEAVNTEQGQAGEQQATELEAQREEVRAEQADIQGENAQRTDDQNFENGTNRQEAENLQQRDAGTAEGRYQELRDDDARDENGPQSDVSRGLSDPLYHHADWGGHPIHIDQSHALRDHFAASNGLFDNGASAQDHGARWQTGWHMPIGDHHPLAGFQQAGFAATRAPDGAMGFNGFAGRGASDTFANFFVPAAAAYGLGQIAPAQWPGAMAAKQDPVDQTTRAILQNHYDAQISGADGGMKVKPANFGYSFGGNFAKTFGLSPAPSEEG